MDRKDRKTLKGYFLKGKVPTEGEFAQLIDSVPNIAEDGHIVCTEEGWALHPHKQRKMRVTLHEAAGEPAVWILALTPDKGLAITNEAGEMLLELKQDKQIALYASVEQGGRPGPEYREMKADKHWQDLVNITDLEEGSHVYSVIALYRDKDLGVCKLTRATAICLNSIEQWVESPRKHWWGWSGRIRFRWQEKDGKIWLQVRSTRKSYSGKIYCQVTEIFKK